MVIPAEITANHGVNQEEVFRRGPAADGIEDAVFEFATIAHEHLETARDMVLKDDGVPKQAMSIFLAGVRVIHIASTSAERDQGTGVKLSQAT